MKGLSYKDYLGHRIYEGDDIIYNSQYKYHKMIVISIEYNLLLGLIVKAKHKITAHSHKIEHRNSVKVIPVKSFSSIQQDVRQSKIQ